jgi:outer membrane protein assembly factor BamD
MSLPRLALLGLAAVALAACAGDDDLADDSRPVEEIFAEADGLAADGDLVAAAAKYDDVERLYPYSQLAKEAVLKSARAYYFAEQYTEARLAAERFLSFYPADPLAAEAQYIIALTWYDQIADVGRDQGNTREALSALRETVQRFPDTDFARSAALKLDLTLDHLAGKEMEVGRFYLVKDQHVAAINRFRVVIEQYPTTGHVAEALFRLVEANLILGLNREAQNAAAVLGYNFPGSDWYARAFDLLTGQNLSPEEDPDSWLKRVYRTVIEGEQL